MGKPNISIGIGSFLPYQLKNMKVYAFIGSSGYGFQPSLIQPGSAGTL